MPNVLGRTMYPLVFSSLLSDAWACSGPPQTGEEPLAPLQGANSADSVV